jgi:hypothetical protein
MTFINGLTMVSEDSRNRRDLSTYLITAVQQFLENERRIGKG